MVTAEPMVTIPLSEYERLRAQDEALGGHAVLPVPVVNQMIDDLDVALHGRKTRFGGIGLGGDSRYSSLVEEVRQQNKCRCHTCTLRDAGGVDAQRSEANKPLVTNVAVGDGVKLNTYRYTDATGKVAARAEEPAIADRIDDATVRLTGANELFGLPIPGAPISDDRDGGLACSCGQDVQALASRVAALEAIKR